MRWLYSCELVDILSSVVPASRTCRVTVKELDRAAHTVTVQGATLYEAAAAAVTAFCSEAWATNALTPNAVLNIEVHAPPVLHTVPLRAVERWLQAPSTSPKEQAVKRALSKS